MADETEVPRLIEECARPLAAHADGHGADRPRRRAGVRAARDRADPRRAGVAARAAAGRRQGARPLPHERARGPHRRERLRRRGVAPAPGTRRRPRRSRAVHRRRAGASIRAFSCWRAEIRRLPELAAGVRAPRSAAVLDRVAAHFLTQDGKPRRSGTIHPYRAHALSHRGRRQAASRGRQGARRPRSSG